jgi:hypothetical protein
MPEETQPLTRLKSKHPISLTKAFAVYEDRMVVLNRM